MASRTPPAQAAIDAALVRALLASQHPDLARLPIQSADSGWDNAMYRLGDALAVRLPRRTIAAALIEREQEWLPRVGPRLPLAVPAPVRIGLPGQGYPWRWSVVPWIAGTAADLAPPEASEAPRFADFLRALHVAAPAEAPRNAFRGVPLREREATFAERAGRLAARGVHLDPAVPRAWRKALEAPVDAEPTWIHGDLHARNVLVEQGRIAGVIDWGDMAAGDRATDLAAAWTLFDAPAERAAVRAALPGLPEAAWTRAKGWAVLFGVMLLETGLADHPRHAAMGAATLRRIASD